jgi:hypothetical protein
LIGRLRGKRSSIHVAKIKKIAALARRVVCFEAIFAP